MSHGCSCGASCQCPAGQCNCPVHTTSTCCLLNVANYLPTTEELNIEYSSSTRRAGGSDER
ncbi:hypothetical protein BDW74DRAFT_161516 [Aspergillus multicolor]|uniref:uncharacterized protein n=1 Tax=Aspergillus multicolor TaxID=41759 RepID=UPI003CCD04B3